MGMPATSQDDLRKRSRTATLSVAVATTLMLLKLVVAVWTGSIAIIASCLDSLLDMFASSVNWFAIRAAEEPPDEEHPYGHGKAEYLGGLFQGVIIGSSGLFVLGEAVSRLWQPHTVTHGEAAIAVMAFSIVASALLVYRLRAAARSLESPALRADSVHYLTDVYSNAGALAALALVVWTGSSLPDTIGGFIIAGIVLYSAFDVLRESIDGLMDRKLPPETLRAIRAVILEHPEVIGIHDLRARRAGPNKFVQVHVDMNESLSFPAAHRIAEEVTTRLEELLDTAFVIVHPDPVQVDASGRVIGRPSIEPPAAVPE